MGSKTFEGVWFISYSSDHPPMHVHGEYGDAIVVVELLAAGGVRKAVRGDAVEPKNAKRGDVRRILDVAERHAGELREIWRRAHGA